MKLTVASYNVHGFVGGDGVRDVRRVAKVLLELGADVVALQEVGFDAEREDPTELLAEMSGYHAVGAPIRRHDGMRHGNAILTRLPIANSRRICLDYQKREPRTALEVWLETGGRPLRVVATHLGLRPGERRFQVREILKHVEGDERSVTVLLGDFNEWFLMGRPLRWLHRRFGRSAAVATWPTRFPIFALDRIWVSPPSALTDFKAVTTRTTRQASDHLPVIAELNLAEE